MRKNHIVKIKVTKEEKTALINRSKQEGFDTLSGYVRWRLKKKFQNGSGY